MIVFYIALYICFGLFMFFMFNDLFFDDERFYKIFNKRWARIIFRLSWLFLWPLWILLFVVIILVFLFETFIDILIK